MATAPQPPIDPRLSASIENWKRSLLDLTRRNRALNFRPARVSTVVITGEQPAEVYRQLCLEGGALKFQPAPEPPAESATAPGAPPAPAAGGALATGTPPAPQLPAADASDAPIGAPGTPPPGLSGEPQTPGAPIISPNAPAPRLSAEPHTPLPAPGETAEPAAPADATADGGGADPLFDDASPAPSLDFTPYDPATLDARQTDDSLQTTAQAEQLDTSLRRLDEQARLAIEEQGVNTLFLTLGMLHYKEAPESSEVFRAPLILVPVALTRKSARTGYVVRATDDDPLVNPALVEYLRRFHSLALPELAEAASAEHNGGHDLQAFFQAVRDQIAPLAGWAVKTDLYLGLFSFQKFVMYKDIEANSLPIARHPLVQQLVTRAGSAQLGLPADIQSLDLDTHFPPEQSAQVVDADSSQLRAIAAAARGHTLVIEGPPGTGKSQTITNLIAQALGAGQSVLFVAEKMAALQVVYNRLVLAGLGEFCLELHSRKANKREVMNAMRQALDASLQRPALPGEPAGPRLPVVRGALSEYTRAVHAPAGALELSPFQAYGALGAVYGAPRCQYSGPAQTVSRAQLDQTQRELTDLAAAAGPIGVPAQHPWRDSGRTFFSEADLDQVRNVARDLLAQLAALPPLLQAAAARLGLPPITTGPAVAAAAGIAALIAQSPGAPLAVLQSDEWNSTPSAAAALIARGRVLAQLQARLGQEFTADALRWDHAADITFMEQKLHSPLSLLAILDGRYRATRARWDTYRLPGFRSSPAAQAQEMKLISQLQRETQMLTAAEPQGRALFGALWRGPESDWDALEAYQRWVVAFRALARQHALGAAALQAASTAHPDLSAFEQLRAAAEAVQAGLARLCAAAGWPAGHLAEAEFSAIAERVRALAENAALAPRWAAFETARARAARGLAAELLPPAMSGEVAFAELAAAFQRAFYQKWLSEIVQARAPLAAFSTLSHEQRVAEFRRLDEQVLLENRLALVAHLREAVQQRLQQPEAAAAMPYLRREMARQRGLSPLRSTLRFAGPAIRAIKPCFMMSPQSVAQFLEGGAPSFDLVIFDEASQLPTEDALGAIFRGRQLVVVGDPKQLPPTNFFTVMSGQVSAPLGDDGLPLYEDSESVLEEYLGAGVPASRLKWHYRSLQESLIAFSNVSFYDGDLYTFPSPATNRGQGLSFEFVADGVYEGKGLNLAEARRVADAVVAHARAHPEQSLGVGTFNLRQQLAIQDELEQRRRADPSLEPFFANRDEGAFFVKNLENIQGDERDVIFISVTYARGPDGRLRYNFGPLNAQNGWRRLNVLITRARLAMRVFASMHGDDINPGAAVSPGPTLLREFLIYAERGRLDNTRASLAAATESPFERDVFEALSARGAHLVPQVGVSGYRIDFGVLDPTVEGRFVCGLECDGVAYHAAQSARDRDRLRQQVLEARGWTIIRLWSTDWFKDRAGQIERLLGLIEDARQQAQEASQAANTLPGEEEPGSAAGATTKIGDAEPSGAALPASQRPQPASADDYQRPAAPAYRLTPGERYSGELLEAPLSRLQGAVDLVAGIEAPLHVSDLVARVAGLWGSRLGTRIRGRVLEALAAALRQGQISQRGDFIYRPEAAVAVRSRSGTHIPPERVAPEEYREAVLMVLRAGRGFTRPELANEVRTLLGFGRASEPLQQALEAQVARLLAEGRLGEGSAGLTLRQSGS